MAKPATWKDDPGCGHEVACAYQTHYCTYIRAPRLLTLQRPQTDQPAEMLAILALQAYELWLAVLISDLRAALERLAAGDATREPTKLLRRCARLIQLLERQTDVADAVLVRDAGARIPLRPGQYGWSSQFAELASLAALLGTRYVAVGPAQSYAEARDEFLGLVAAWQPRFTGLLAGMVQPATVGRKVPDYPDYLALEELLSLQEGVKADWTPKDEEPTSLAPGGFVSPDELMFIVVHQAFELWFKAILHELDGALAAMLAPEPEVPEAARRLRRVVRIQRLLVEQIHIPATMLPLDFFRFRSQSKVVDGVTWERGLSPSSGTESYQFREIEIVAGLKGNEAHGEFLQGTPRLPVRFLTPAQEGRLAEPSLPEAFEQLLERRGIRNVVEIFTAADTPNPHADLADLADTLLDFDEFFRLWRINHATMVQVMIGERSGTGFLGPEYLRETAGMGLQGEGRVFARSQARPRFFEALWSARTKLGTG